MAHDASQSPATKADIGMLMDSIGALYAANEGWKNSILEDMKTWKEEIVRHFDVAVEHIRHELLAAKRERIEILDDRTKGHEKRIKRLEIHAGI